jgi:hypothetical protein
MMQFSDVQHNASMYIYIFSSNSTAFLLYILHYASTISALNYIYMQFLDKKTGIFG